LSDREKIEYNYSNFFVECVVKVDDYGGRGIYLTTDVSKGTKLVNVCCSTAEDALKNHFPLNKIGELSDIALSHAIQVDAEHVCIDPDELLGEDGKLAINFINHHCNPSTWFVPNSFILEARHNMLAGDEITFDYATVDYLPVLLDMKCECKSTSCRKTIVGSKHIAQFYYPHVSKHMANIIK